MTKNSSQNYHNWITIETQIHFIVGSIKKSKGDFTMYGNDHEQDGNNSYSGNEKPQEYFYTAGTSSSQAYSDDRKDNYREFQGSQGVYGNFSGAYSGYQTTGQADTTKKHKKQKREKKPHPVLKKVASMLLLGLLFGAAAGIAFSIPTYLSNKQLRETELEIAKTNLAASKTEIGTTGSLATADGAVAPASDVTKIAESCLPSVVSITNKSITEVRTMFGTYQQDNSSSGSGIIIGENETELLIVTNYHVVAGSNELSVVFSYDENSENPSLVSAKLKGYDEDKDLAVIAVSSDDITNDMRAQIKIATIGDSSSLQLGQQVVAIGNALGYGQSVTQGIISALNREVSVQADSGRTITNRLIQTDAAINPGNSGGALLNMKGELVGINSVKVAVSSVEGMGYAIPISDVQSIIEDLMLQQARDVVDEEQQGYLGIGGTDVSQEISQTYGMPVGIFINNIYENSPAGAAGLSKGNIIVKFDNHTVTSMSELKSLLTHYRHGETVEVVAMVQTADGYEEKTFQVTLASKDVFGKEAQQQTQESNVEQKPEEGKSFQFEFPGNFFWPFP